MERTEIVKEEMIQELQFLVKEYEDATAMIAKIKQRLAGLDGCNDTLLKRYEGEQGMEAIKGRITRMMEKHLFYFDVYESYLKNIPGIGPWIAAKLIILFYYRFIPVCKDCGGNLEKEQKKSKRNGEMINVLICQKCGKQADDGLLKHKLDFKDFPTISKWWAYMGRHTDGSKMPKRQKGTQINWSTEGRTLGFHIYDQFNRQPEDHLYKKLFIERKRKHAANHPEWTKGHIHNAAGNETVKIFLAHFWTVARSLDGKTVSDPYAGALMGHTNITKPFYWEDEESKLMCN